VNSLCSEPVIPQITVFNYIMPKIPTRLCSTGINKENIVQRLDATNHAKTIMQDTMPRGRSTVGGRN